MLCQILPPQISLGYYFFSNRNPNFLILAQHLQLSSSMVRLQSWDLSSIDSEGGLIFSRSRDYRIHNAEIAWCLPPNQRIDGHVAGSGRKGRVSPGFLCQKYKMEENPRVTTRAKLLELKKCCSSSRNVQCRINDLPNCPLEECVAELFPTFNCLLWRELRSKAGGSRVQRNMRLDLVTVAAVAVATTIATNLQHCPLPLLLSNFRTRRLLLVSRVPSVICSCFHGFRNTMAGMIQVSNMDCWSTNLQS
ncbi:hypothetical protein HHK36_013593 [Tetracentron sinense]|uniref:Uncharacterized protein n=1 Tax=Tetracentron sinense TaxID=13715 RepID=A0A834ZAN5_TETSI|nr:hypothetical protein HHK36_013593 [Tetracentron sinense]